MKAKIYAVLTAMLLSLLVLPASRADVQLNSVSTAGISAKIVPAASESGVKNVYMGAKYGNDWYLRDAASNWSLYKGGPLPIAGQISLPLASAAPYVSVSIANFDISSLAGLDVYVAYGASDNDALSTAGHLAKVYTVPGTPVPPVYGCMDSTATNYNSAATSQVGITCTYPAPVAQVLHYTDKVYALWTGHYPYTVTKTGVTRVANKTSLAGAWMYFNCWMAETPLANGKVLVDCQDGVSYNRHLLYIDPTTDELHEYETAVQVWDTTPASNGGVCGWCKILDYPAGTTWQDVQVYDPAYPSWDAKVKVPDGWYFTTDASWVLNFKSDTTGAITVVKAGTFADEGNIFLLMSYSN